MQASVNKSAPDRPTLAGLTFRLSDLTLWRWQTPVITRQFDPESQPVTADEIQRPEGRRAGCPESEDVRGAVTVRRLQLIPEVAIRGERKSFSATAGGLT